MSFVSIRRAMHAGHAVTTLVLIASGLLIGFPDLRAQLLGGYGRELANVHLYFGLGFIAIPALAAAVAAPSLYRDTLRRLGPPDPLTWRKLHIVVTLVAGLLLTVSGIMLWLDTGMPLAASDAALAVHEILTYVLAAALPIHLVVGRRKIAERVRVLLGREPAFDPTLPPGHPDDAQ